MALPSLGFRTVSFGGTGFFAVSSRSSSGADDAFFDGFSSAPLFALFAQPERVTRAVYFSRSLGGFEGLEGLESASSSDDADGEVTNANILNNAVGAAETSDDAVGDALVSGRRKRTSRRTRVGRRRGARGLGDGRARAAARRDIDACGHDACALQGVVRNRRPEGRSRRGAQSGRGLSHRDAELAGVEFTSRAPRRVDANDADDDTPPLNVARALVGASSLLLVVAAAVACVQAVLVACDWACRAVFGEEAEEADGVASAVDEVSLAAPLLDFAYETAERAISRARDEGGDGDGEQLLVLVPLEPEGRRTS